MEDGRYDSDSRYGSDWGSSRRRGEYRGKGPKNYKRSDSRIQEDINDRLSDDWHLDATNISVEVKDAEVILTGTVNDRQAKRRAEDVAESISGVNHVENRLRVSKENSGYLSESSTAYTSGTTTGTNDSSNDISLASTTGTTNKANKS